MTDRPAARRSILKLLGLSFCFLLVFLAYNGTQTIMSSLIPGRLGYWSISCIYISFMTCALFLSTGVVLVITPKWSMFLGSLIYAGFIAANLKPMWWTLVPLAVALGLAASILWAGEGAYVTTAAMVHAESLGRPTRASMGMFNGIFFGIFQLSMLVGNILSSVILRRGGGNPSSSGFDSEAEAEASRARARILFYSYVAICGCGIIGLLLLPHPKATGVTIDESKVQVRGGKSGGIAKMAGAVVMLKDPKMALLIPFLLYTGIEQAFIFGDFTKNFVKEHHGLAMVGFVMAVFGASDSVSSVILGRIADRVGPRWIIVFGNGLMAIFIVAIWILQSTRFGQSLIAAFMFSTVLGIADAAIFSVFCNAAMATLFSDRSEAAFSNLKVFQAGGTALSFFLGPQLHFNVKLSVLSGMLVIGSIGIFVLDRFVHPLSRVKEVPSVSLEASTIQAEKTPLVGDAKPEQQQTTTP